jgi:hypothetical protein
MTAVGPMPVDLRAALGHIHGCSGAQVRTNVSQAGVLATIALRMQHPLTQDETLVFHNEQHWITRPRGDRPEDWGP